MRSGTVVGLLPILLTTLVALPGAGAEAPPASPYAGQQTREIKALSDREVASLLAGKGMGFAKAAELNGYPGPAHVLELGDALDLTAAQRERTRELFAAMERDAMTLGKALVQAERELDQFFASRSATRGALDAALARVGELQARLRGVHLAAHIEQTAILSGEQVARYAQLRGYADDGQDGGHRHGHGGAHGQAHGHGDGHGHDHDAGHGHGTGHGHDDRHGHGAGHVHDRTGG